MSRTTQKKYVIRVSKKYEFPSCVLNKDNTLRDLFDKGQQEFAESVERNGMDMSQFVVELDVELPFKAIREPNQQQLTIGRKSVSFQSMESYIRDFVSDDIEAKYGPLDIEKNPGIFITQVNNDINTSGATTEDDTITTYVLTKEVNNYYNSRYDYYYEVLRRRNI